MTFVTGQGSRRRVATNRPKIMLEGLSTFSNSASVLSNIMNPEALISPSKVEAAAAPDQEMARRETPVLVCEANSELVLPDPCLVVLCGPSGAGKSTFAREHFRPTQIVSSDHCRSLINDSETFGPETSTRAFALLDETIRHRLELRRLTVADTTALERGARARFLELAGEARVPAVLIMLQISTEECLRRDQARKRHVGVQVIARQQRLFGTTRHSVASEGFHCVYVLTEETENAIRVRLESEPEAIVSELRQPIVPTPFEGWIKPWPDQRDADSGSDSEHKGAPPTGPDGETAPIAQLACDEIRAVVGDTSEGDRRAAMRALLAMRVDPRWILFRPARPEPPSPGASGFDSAADTSFDSVVEALRLEGFRRAALEAWPAGAQPVGLVVAREPYHAVRLLGVEGWGAIWGDPGPPLLEPEALEPLLERMANDLNGSAYYSRRKTSLFVAQALALWDTGHPAPDASALDSPCQFSPHRPRNAQPEQLRLLLTDLLAPPESSDPDNPEFLWMLAETSNLAEVFCAAPRLILDLASHGPAAREEDRRWWSVWSQRPGWRIVLARTTKTENQEGREHEREKRKGCGKREICDIGWRRPPRVLLESSGGERPSKAPAAATTSSMSSAAAAAFAVDAGGNLPPTPFQAAHARALWECRSRAIRELTSGAPHRPWRPWVAAAWGLPPSPEPDEQEDLFGERSN